MCVVCVYSVLHLSSMCAGGREARAVDGLILIAVDCLDGESDVESAVKLCCG